MSKPAPRPVPARTLAALLLATASCTSGLGQLQTARTLPPGEFRSTLSGGYAWNFMVDQRPANPGNLVAQYAARFGVRENLDMGVKLFFGLGALVDAKVQLLARPRLAVSLLGGAGGAFDAESGAEVLHAPIMLLASYRVVGPLTPYVGAGYGAFWIFNYGSEPNVPAGSYPAARAWHGDGLMMLHAGIELAITVRTALLLEYGYLRPIVEDPGDHYEFAINHLFLAGVHF
jgi:opacity protein-like surface antigen